MARKKSAAQIEAEARAMLKAADTLEKATERLMTARVAQQQAEDFDPSNDSPSPEPTEISEAEPSKLEKVLAECGSEGSFSIYRENENGQSAKCGQYDIDNWPQALETVARQKGGGTFKVRFQRPNGEFVNQTTRTYDSDLYKKPGTLAAQVAAPVDNMAMLTLINQIQQQNQTMQNEASKRTETMMLKMMEIQSNAKAAPGGLDLKTIVELVRGNKSDSPVGQIKEMVSMLKALKEDDLVEPESPISSAINKLIAISAPFLEAAAGKLADQPGNAPAGRVAAPPVARLPGNQAPVEVGSGTALPAPNPPGVETPPGDALPTAAASIIEAQQLPPGPLPPEQEEATYVEYGEKLVTSAEVGTDPELACMFGLNAIQKLEDAEGLKLIAQDPDVVERVMRYCPASAEYGNWMEAFFQCVADGIDEKIERLKNPPPPPPPSQHGANPAGKTAEVPVGSGSA